MVKSLPSIILYSSTLVGLANKDAMEFSLEDNQRCSESFDGSGMLWFFKGAFATKPIILFKVWRFSSSLNWYYEIFVDDFQFKMNKLY